MAEAPRKCLKSQNVQGGDRPRPTVAASASVFKTMSPSRSSLNVLPLDERKGEKKEGGREREKERGKERERRRWGERERKNPQLSSIPCWPH